MSLSNTSTEKLKKELERRENAKKNLVKIRKFITKETIDLLAPDHTDDDDEYIDEDEKCSDKDLKNGIQYEKDNESGSISCSRCALLEINAGTFSLSDLPEGVNLVLSFEE